MTRDLSSAAGAEAPIRVFVGATEEQMLAVRVLDYSIQRTASRPVELVPIHRALAQRGIELPLPSRPSLRARTPFSFQRFAIPELVGFSGRAIYLDSDMQLFRDIAELWQSPLPVPLRTVAARPWRLRKPQLSVMLLDCARLTWRVDELIRRLDGAAVDYAAIMDGSALATALAGDLPPCWNDLEHYRAGDTALLHYTDMSRQPWLDSSNRLAALWCRALVDAVEEGFIDAAEVRQAVERGSVRPSLAYQVEHRIVDPRRLPREQRLLDLLRFVPPHRRADRGASTRGGGRFRANLRLVGNDLGLAAARARLGHAYRLARSRI